MGQRCSGAVAAKWAQVAADGAQEQRQRQTSNMQHNMQLEKEEANATCRMRCAWTQLALIAQYGLSPASAAVAPSKQRIYCIVALVRIVGVHITPVGRPVKLTKNLVKLHSICGQRQLHCCGPARKSPEAGAYGLWGICL